MIFRPTKIQLRIDLAHFNIKSMERCILRYIFIIYLFTVILMSIFQYPLHQFAFDFLSFQMNLNPIVELN
jgi:hypothetical protein